MLAWLKRLFALGTPLSGALQVQEWERKLIRQAVENRFAEEHRGPVLTELGRMRAEWLAAPDAVRTDAEELVRLIVRTQLDVIEESAGDPAFLTEEHYKQSVVGLTDEDRLCVLDQLIKDLQLLAKDVASLVGMLDDRATRRNALSALGHKGPAGAAAVPRLVELLADPKADQQDCSAILRTLTDLGPAAREAVPAVAGLVNDADYLIRLFARAALKAIAPRTSG